MVMHQALAIMARQPIAGKTKTRLCPPLTAIQAAELYACFLRDMLVAATGLDNVDLFIAYTPAGGETYFAGLAPHWGLLSQRGDSLNARLNQVMVTLFDQGYEKVVAVNSDSPDLPPPYLAAAFLELEGADLVFGPAADGGYYLIGARRPCPELLLPVTMSTATVLQETLALAAAGKMTAALLPEWYDVDTYADLQHLTQAMLDGPVAGPGRHTRSFLLRELPALVIEAADRKTS